MDYHNVRSYNMYLKCNKRQLLMRSVPFRSVTIQLYILKGNENMLWFDLIALLSCGLINMKAITDTYS